MADELQNIRELEQELVQQQQIELRIKADDGRNPYQKLIDASAGSAGLYTDPKKMNSLIIELQLALDKTLKNSNIQGRIFGKKALEKYLLESEKRDITDKALRLINKANARRVRNRLELAYLELNKEVGILKADIEIFKKNARIAGFTNKEILAQLVKLGRDKEGVVQAFSKRVKSNTVAAVRRERTSAEIDEYRKVAKLGELWQWIAISSKPCGDCSWRAGKVLTISRWEKMGLPGSGRTICGRFCRCKLMPLTIADERFPTVKTFTFDPDKLVLTTASEARTLKAKVNQPPQKVKKNGRKKSRS
jgi:hypothetical protein